MYFGFSKNKDVDGIIISYLDISDYVTLLKTNKNLQELFKISDIIHKDKVFDFLNYLVNVKDFNYAINVIKEMQSNDDCISKYNFEDFSDNPNIFSELIVMSGIENEELLYDFTEYYMFDYLCDLNETMQSLYDIISDEYPLNYFIKKLLYFNKSHLAKRAIELIISRFHDGDLYTYYTFVFDNDKHFNSFVVENYIKIIPAINWEKFVKHLKDCLIHNIFYKCNNNIETRLNYINEFLEAAKNLKCSKLLDIVEYLTEINIIRDVYEAKKFKGLIENARKTMIS